MFHTIFYVPLYNALILVTNFFGGSLGLGVIGLTLLVKLILSPLSYQSTVSQIAQKKLLPFVNEIKKKYPDQKEQATKLNELYKEHKAHPLSGCLLLLLQLPILFAIFYVFQKGALIVPEDLYSFVHVPETIRTMFLGIDVTKPNVILLVITALAQYFQIALSPMMQQEKKTGTKSDNPQEAIADNMQKMMKYLIPVMIVAGGWKLPAAVAIYWTLSSLFTLAQERIIMRLLEKKKLKIS